MVDKNLATDFNVDPYFDDFDASKNFHRILFRPGFAVQARELTQMQTMLQNQIDRFGEHMFKEGSFVSGGETDVHDCRFVRIRDNDNVAADVDPTDFSNTIITGASSGVQAHVILGINGTEAALPDTNTLYVRYIDGGSNNDIKDFNGGERFTINANTAISANVLLSGAFGNAQLVTIRESVIFAKDNFILCPEQTIIIGKYTSNTNVEVGYAIAETIVDSDTDGTLLDGASGSYNFAAPGADRLKLDPILTSLPYGTGNTNFISIISIKDGITQEKNDKTEYNILADNMARRTFAESGHYVVKGNKVRVREHLDSGTNGGVFTSGDGGVSTKLAVQVLPGKAFISGYEIDKYVTETVAVDKGTDTVEVEDVSVPANYGNYAYVREVVGVWDTDGHDEVSLRDTASHGISNGEFSTTTGAGAEVGTARVRGLEYSSGTIGTFGCVYKAYLYDIKMTSGEFPAVRSIFLNNASDADVKADTVLVANSAVIQEPSFNRAIYPTGVFDTRRIRIAGSTTVNDTSFNFFKTFPITVDTAGLFSISTSPTDEDWPYAVGALNASQKEDIIVTLNQSTNASSILTGTVTVSGNTFTGSGTDFQNQLSPGDRFKVNDYANTFTVTVINTATDLDTLETTGGISSGHTIVKNFEVGQVLSLSSNGTDAATRTAVVVNADLIDFDIKEPLYAAITGSAQVRLTKVDGQEITKTINRARLVELATNTHVANTVGPWNLGFSDMFRIASVRKHTSAFVAVTDGADVTTHFTMDSGQRDNFYDHGKLKKKTSSTLVITSGDHLLVELDYFSHIYSSGIGYFSIDSYPVDDDTPTGSKISTQQIPIYRSPTDDKEFDLRDAIDIRPRIVDTSADVTVLSGISTNPANNAVIFEPTGGLHFSPPNENWQMDMSYYQGRRDTVTLDDVGTVRVLRGNPASSPLPPVAPANQVNLGELLITPFPSLPFDTARSADRFEKVTKFRPKSNRRFTMNDIGTIAQRVETLEYYTSLSLLEIDAEKTFFASSTGLNRFKNGFVVDNFVGHNIGDVFNLDYKIAIDSNNQELRPEFQLTNVETDYNTTASSLVQTTPNDVRLTVGSGTYSNLETITQGGASGTLRFQVGTRLYIEDITGTFSVSGAAVGGTSGTSSTISAIKDYGDVQSKYITLPYTHQILVDQPQATNDRIVAWGGLSYRWAGILQIDPAVDYWVDTTTRPEINVDLRFEDIYAGFQFIVERAGWSTWWDDWQTIQSSVTREGNWTTTVTEQTRTGGQIVVQPGALAQQNLGTSIRDVNLQPFMRSRVINFLAGLLKPNTRHYVFFDDVDVSAFITPTNSDFANTALEGARLVTDNTGLVYGQFRIPSSDALRFPTGQRVLRITDNSQNSMELGLVSSACETEYTSQGIDTIEQGTVISTRPIEIQTQTTFDSRTVVSNVFVPPPRPRGGGCPAQSIFINPFEQTSVQSDGVFITKVDLFFKTKSATIPMSVLFLEMTQDSGQITIHRIPLSLVVIPPEDINISEDGSAPTPVYFETPIFLKRDTEYALDIASPDPDYRFFISKLGENDFITGLPVIQQAHTGVLFASSNAKTAISFQDEDMKFRIYAANFTKNQDGTAIFKNKDLEYLSVDTVSAAFNIVGEKVDGDSVITTSALTGGAASANVGEFISTSTSNGQIRVISGTDFSINAANGQSYQTGEAVTFFSSGGIPTGVTAVSITAVATPNAEVVLYDPVNSANTFMEINGSSGTYVANSFIRGITNNNSARILTIRNLNVDTIHPMAAHIIPEGTTLTPSLKMASTVTALETAFTAIDLNENTDFGATKFVLSKTNEVSDISSAKSVQMKFVLNTTNKNVSPIIDRDQVSLTTVHNLVNNTIVGEANTAGGDAFSKYITRTTTLEDGQESEDIRVILAAYKPATANIKVYYKILHEVDDNTMEQVSWAPMNQVTSTLVTSDSENRKDFKEYEYRIPTTALTGSGGEVQYTNSNGITFTGFKKFKIKIVFNSSNTYNPPRVKDMRVIALQI